MKLPFIVITQGAALFIAYLCPLWLVLRGRRLRNVVLTSWAILFLYVLFLSLVLPAIVSRFDRNLGKEMLASWVPEGPGIIAMAIVGWIPPLMAGGIALFVRLLLSKFCPPLFEKLSKPSGKQRN